MNGQGQITTLYSEVVDITTDYLGPAADRYIKRQIEGHLNKQPDQLKKGDLRTLIEWIKISMSLLTDDHELVDKYIEDLRRLTL